MFDVNLDLYDLSDVMIDFCRESNIDIDRISASGMMENARIDRINPFVSRYGISDIESPGVEDICIKDIVGWDPLKEKRTLFRVLEDCYSDGFGTYHTRSNDKLRLGKDGMFNDIKSSLTREEIWVNEVEGKYVVTVNGCHRTSILRLLYLDEALKNESSIEEINQKYTIRSKVDKYDMTLTYINFFMQSIDSDYYINIQRGENYAPTGKYIIGKNKDNPLTREELINNFTELVNNNEEKFDLYGMEHFCEIPSFKEFAKTYFPALVKEEQYGNIN